MAGANQRYKINTMLALSIALAFPSLAVRGQGYGRDDARSYDQRFSQYSPPPPNPDVAPRGPSGARITLSDGAALPNYPDTGLPPWQETAIGRRQRVPQVEATYKQPSEERLSASPIPVSEVPQDARPEGAVMAGSFGPESGPMAGLKQFDDAKVMAVVGDQFILAGDIEPEVDLMLAPFIESIPRELLEEQRESIEAERQKYIRNVLKSSIDTKVVYLDFLRTVPAERIEMIRGKIDKQFDERFAIVWQEVADAKEGDLEKIMQRDRLIGRLVMMMQKEKITTQAELDSLLRRYGSSLKKQRRNYQEQIMSQQMVRNNANFDAEISHAEMLAYFEQHSADYEYPARARWEQLTARFDRFRSREEALDAIADMGNRVYLGGRPLEAVARELSSGSTASEGGQHDWTTEGSLASKPLDEALFSIELNKLSPIIEDTVGLHIIRVLERQSAGRKQFGDVQKEIEQKIRNDRRNEEVDAYLAKVKASARIWTIYDDQPQPEAQQ